MRQLVQCIDQAQDTRMDFVLMLNLGLKSISQVVLPLCDFEFHLQGYPMIVSLHLRYWLDGSIYNMLWPVQICGVQSLSLRLLTRTHKNTIHRLVPFEFVQSLFYQQPCQMIYSLTLHNFRVIEFYQYQPYNRRMNPYRIHCIFVMPLPIPMIFLTNWHHLLLCLEFHLADPPTTTTCLQI